MESSAFVYIGLTITTICLALCVRNREFVPRHIAGGYGAGEYRCLTRQQARNGVAEAAVWALLAGVSACRIAVGNDYWVYRENFKLIAQERHVASEWGFNLIVRWMQALFGYDRYLPIFGLFSLLTTAFFVLALRDQGEDFAFSLFLLLTNGYYFNSLNSVRYYLVLAIALYAMKYVLRGDYGRFLFWVLFGTIFHKSILFILPVYPLAKYLAVSRLKWYHYLAVGAFGGSLVFGQDFYRAVIFRIYPFYENSAFDNGQISYINIAKCAAVLLLGLLLCRKKLAEDVAARFYFILNLGAIGVYLAGDFIPEASRIGYYLSVGQLFLLPKLVDGIGKEWLKKLAVAGILICFAVYFVFTLRGMYDVNVRLLPYRNWIFQ